MRIFLKVAAAAIVAATIPMAIQATTVQYAPGVTTLSITADKYKVEIRSPLVNPGNSTRVYMRPRNGNCTGAMYNDNKKALTVKDNPSCNDDKYGYVSLDVPSKDAIMNDADKKIEVGMQMGGTLKTYKVGFVATLDPTGNVLIGGMSVN